MLGALIIPMGGLGDRLGRKRMLIGGLVLFGVASAACAFADTAGQLIAARAVQGVGGAAMMPLSLAMLPVLFHDRDERLRAMNIWVTASAVGLPLGPIVGGWLLDSYDWGWVFLINIPLVAVGVLALAVWLPETRSEHPRPVDVPGIVLSCVALSSLTYGLIRAGDHGWANGVTIGSLAVGVVLLLGFVLWERRAASPIVEMALFDNRSFTVGTALATIANFALFGLLFVMPQYFQDIGGSTPLETGVRLLPMIGGMALATRLGPMLVKRAGASAVIVGGLAVSAVALGLASTTDLSTGYGFTAIWITLLGAGIGLVLPASMSVAMGALSAERAGAGSGLLQALRQVGGTIGVAILGTVLSGSTIGLRERKKIKLRRSVQQEALRLFAEQGYDATTVEQIADAADISTTTFYRYFPTKEDTVFHDEYDLVVEEIVEASDPQDPLVDVVRRVVAALSAALEDERETALARLRPRESVPALKARLGAEGQGNRDLYLGLFSRRTGRPVDDYRLRVTAAALTAAQLEAVHAWGDADGATSLRELMDEAVTVLEPLLVAL